MEFFTKIVHMYMIFYAYYHQERSVYYNGGPLHKYVVPWIVYFLTSIKWQSWSEGRKYELRRCMAGQEWIYKPRLSRNTENTSWTEINILLLILSTSGYVVWCMYARTPRMFWSDVDFIKRRANSSKKMASRTLSKMEMKRPDVITNAPSKCHRWFFWGHQWPRDG